MDIEELKQRIAGLEQVIETYNEFGFEVSQEIKDRMGEYKTMLKTLCPDS